MPGFRLVLLVCLAAGLAACATPVAPSGGPADTTPPSLVSSRPATGATRVAGTEAGTEVVLTFSERLDAASAARAVRVTPAPEAPPRVSVRGRDLVVEIGALRDSTTYVVTVGTELADARRVAIRAPVTVAFATGDRLDAGRIEGTVLDPATGAPAAGLAVWAYALADSADAPPDARTATPDYQTETGADGAFRLGFLRPGPYAVAAVADRNRNGRADAGERFAAAPRRALVATEPDTSAADSAGVPGAPERLGARPTFYTALRDTVPPEPRAARALSDRRVAVRFSESVRVLDAGGATVEDSASGRAVGASLAVLPGSPAEVVAVAAEALAAVPHRLRLDAGAVADSSGTPAAAVVRAFTPLARADTLVARFRAFEPAGDSGPDLPEARLLTPGQAPVLVWTAPPDSASLAARVRVVDADSAAVPVALVPDGARVRIVLPERRAGVFTVSVSTPDSVRTARFTVLGADRLGSIVGRVDGAGARRVVVEAVPERTAFGPDAARAVVPGDGPFEIPDLRPGAYRLRLFHDADGDGRWSPGALAPYVAPEALAFAEEPAAVRARWEADVGPLRLPPAP